MAELCNELRLGGVAAQYAALAQKAAEKRTSFTDFVEGHASRSWNWRVSPGTGERAEKFLGPSGVGQTDLVIGRGHLATQKGYKIRFFSAADLVLMLEAAQRQGRYREVMHRGHTNSARSRSSALPAVAAHGHR